MKTRFPHYHSYRIAKKNAKAYFRKDNWPGDSAFIISGDLRVCSCGAAYIKPHEHEFSEVEVEITPPKPF